jgi:dienelactone hydrolase
MRFLLLAAACLAAAAVSAETAWPPTIAALQRGISESPVAAVLPAGITITPPAADLPADRARFSGFWHGWACNGQACDVRIAVERITAEGATVSYAGTSATQVVHDRAEGRFAGEELHVPLKTGSRATLRLRTDGDMEFALWRANGELASMGVLSQRAADYVRRIERVPTPWTEAGKPVTLEMVVYRPAAATGPLPTAVFNHGSTGNGDRPEWFLHTWASVGLARHFTDKGWQVLFPQRRGRGKSDGLYDEGFLPGRERYACEPELTLPGLERAAADLHVVMQHVQSRADVDAKRLVMGGVSRGGILSVVYAGMHPGSVRGVINFVGGWVGDRCAHADTVNGGLFRRGAASPLPVLWLYGDRDPFYALRHSRRNFEAFQSAGGRGEFIAYDTPAGENGHLVHVRRELWRQRVDAYLEEVLRP